MKKKLLIIILVLLISNSYAQQFEINISSPKEGIQNILTAMEEMCRDTANTEFKSKTGLNLETSITNDFTEKSVTIKDYVKYIYEKYKNNEIKDIDFEYVSSKSDPQSDGTYIYDISFNKKFTFPVSVNGVDTIEEKTYPSYIVIRCVQSAKSDVVLAGTGSVVQIYNEKSEKLRRNSNLMYLRGLGISLNIPILPTVQFNNIGYAGEKVWEGIGLSFSYSKSIDNTNLNWIYTDFYVNGNFLFGKTWNSIDDSSIYKIEETEAIKHLWFFNGGIGLRFNKNDKKKGFDFYTAVKYKYSIFSVPIKFDQREDYVISFTNHNIILGLGLEFESINWFGADNGFLELNIGVPQMKNTAHDFKTLLLELKFGIRRGLVKEI